MMFELSRDILYTLGVGLTFEMKKEAKLVRSSCLALTTTAKVYADSTMASSDLQSLRLLKMH